jgi:hypothetical protein
VRTSTPLAPLPAMAPPDPARPRPPYRFIGTLALLGAALLTGGTVLHPAHADPGSPTEAFAEYAHAGRGTWVAAHLPQLGGAAGLVLVVVLLARAVDRTGGSGWARVTAIFGTAGLAVAAVLQAVDGVALKAMVDLWTGADEDRSSLFAGALAVRQIEIGLHALFALLLALAFLAFGIGLLIAPSGSRRLGALAAATAAAVACNGVALALSGFSAATMLGTTVSGALVLVFMVVAAAWIWRRAVPQRP